MTTKDLPVTTDGSPEGDDISLLDLLIVLAKHKLLILGLAFSAGVVAAVISLLLPNIYTASTKILPPQQNQSTATAMLGQLGAFSALAGGAIGIKNPNDLYVGMLKSRTVADNIIKRFDLKKIYNVKTSTYARNRLQQATTISFGKDGIIRIEIDDKEPKRAADLANAYVDELYKLTQTLAVTEASQRRLFLEKQLKLAKQELASAEVGLKETQEETGLIKLDDQGRVIIEAFARLRAEIAAKEVQLGAMRSFAAERNPELIRTQQELAGLRAQLAKMDKNHDASRGDILVATGQVPEAGLEYLRKLRDVKYYETIFELLAKQYEMAKIDEARDTSLIQVLDQAIEPENKSKPRRRVIVIVTTLAAGFLAVLWAFIKEASERRRQDPQYAERLEALRSYLSWRRSAAVGRRTA